MGLKGFFSQFDIFNSCKKYGFSIWQCPQFLFLVMGAVIMVAAVSVYIIGARFFDDPRAVALIVLFVAAVLFVIASAIIHSFERLAEVSRMKSEFISVVSHQLRSPITNLKWVLEFLMSGRSGFVEEKQTEYFRILKENSDRMAELVSDLLTVSRIETTKMTFAKEETSLGDLIGDLAKEVRPFADASNVEIKIDVAIGLPKILVDPFHFKQVVGNILDNGIRYIKNKGVVAIVVRRRGNYLYIQIEDNGVGIPKDDQKFIFQKFFRSANALRHQTQGSGLGLHIAKSLIEKMGGKIGFKSQEGIGSTFWLTLPIK